MSRFLVIVPNFCGHQDAVIMLGQPGKWNLAQIWWTLEIADVILYDVVVEADMLSPIWTHVSLGVSV